MRASWRDVSIGVLRKPHLQPARTAGLRCPPSPLHHEESSRDPSSGTADSRSLGFVSLRIRPIQTTFEESLGIRPRISAVSAVFTYSESFFMRHRLRFVSAFNYSQSTKPYTCSVAADTCVKPSAVIVESSFQPNAKARVFRGSSSTENYDFTYFPTSLTRPHGKESRRTSVRCREAN